MENFNEENPLQDWIDSDKKLSQILNEIENQYKSEAEQAKIAFHRLSEEYNLPKYPDDVEDREMELVADFHLYNPISMYEVLGKLKFADNNPENIKSQVLIAAYTIKNKLEVYIDEELDEYLGDDVLAGFGYYDEDVDVKMIPIKEGESWFEKGCTFFIREE